MRNKRGIIITEILVIIGVLIVVAIIGYLLVFFANVRARDVKRVSDIGVLRSAMTQVKVQYGSYRESGCAAGGVSTCVGFKLNDALPTLKNFHDPVAGTLCSQNCNVPCEYSFTDAPQDNTFEVLFYLEKGVGNYPQKGCYSLTEAGIQKK